MKNMKKKNALFNRKAFSQRMKKNSEMFAGDRRNADPEAVEISIYSLAAEGYRIDDILDPKMLPAAKSRTYAKITKALNSGSDTADRQIAEAIYNGRQAIDNDINRRASRVDFSSPDVLDSKDLTAMVELGSIISKMGKTQKRFGREIADVAARETDGRVATFEDYCDSKKITPLDMFAASADRIGSITPKTIASASPDKIRSSLGTLIGSRAALNAGVKALAAVQKNDPRLPYTQWVGLDEGKRIIAMKDSVQAASDLDIVQFLGNEPELASEVAERVIEGRYSDVTCEPDGDGLRFEGLPSMTELKLLKEPPARRVSEALRLAKNVRNKNGTDKELNSAVDAMEGFQRLGKRADELEKQNNEKKQREAIENARYKALEAKKSADAFIDSKMKEKAENKELGAETVLAVETMQAASNIMLDAVTTLDNKLLAMDARKRESPERRIGKRGERTPRREEKQKRSADVEELRERRLESAEKQYAERLGSGRERLSDLEARKEALADLAACMIVVNTTADSLEKVKNDPRTKLSEEKMNALTKASMSPETISRNAEALKKRDDFGLMMNSIRTPAQLDAFQKKVMAGDGKLLLGELSNSAKQVAVNKEKAVRGREQHRQLERELNKPRTLTRNEPKM